MNKLICLSVVVAVAALAGIFGFQLHDDYGPAADDDARIVSFSYNHSGSSTLEIYSYEVKENAETGEMAVNYDLFCELFTYTLPADEELMQELSAIIDDHDLHKWDGFDKSSSHVMDGSGFSLGIAFDDGTGISASGDNRFPDGYSEAAKAIDELFRGHLKQHGIDIDEYF